MKEERGKISSLRAHPHGRKISVDDLEVVIYFPN